jgi:hypothetical protein
MSTAWLLNGKLVLDGDGKVILCDECPCIPCDDLDTNSIIDVVWNGTTYHLPYSYTSGYFIVWEYVEGNDTTGKFSIKFANQTSTIPSRSFFIEITWYMSNPEHNENWYITYWLEYPVDCCSDQGPIEGTLTSYEPYPTGSGWINPPPDPVPTVSFSTDCSGG